MNTIVTNRIWNWLQNASQEEKQSYLAGGDPEVISMLNTKSHNLVYYPAIRGIVVDDSPYEDPEKAEEQARKSRDEYAAIEGLPKIDTEWLGLQHQEIIQQADNYDLRTEEVVHLGTKFLAPGCEYANLEDDIELLLEDDDLLPEEIRACITHEGIEMEDHEMFTENLIKKGLMGFLVQFSTPAPRRTNSDEVKFSWGLTRRTWFYGETFSETFEKAKQWVDRIRNTKTVEETA